MGSTYKKSTYTKNQTNTLVDAVTSDLQNQIDDNTTDITNVANTSGDWDSTNTTVNVNSSDWNSVYNTVNSTSGSWDGNFCDETVFIKDLSACTGNMSVTGNIDMNNYTISNVTLDNVSISGMDEFTDLSDTPSTYEASSGYFVRVKLDGTRLVFDDFETTVNTLTSNLQTQITNNDSDITYLSGQIDNSNEFIELTDTPTVYTNASGYFLTVTDNGSGVEFTDFRTEVSTATSSLQTQINSNVLDITLMGASSSSWDNAANLAHAQNTDIGTTSTTFTIASGAANGTILKQVGDELQLRTDDDLDYADIRVGSVTVEGSATIIHSEDVTIADNILTLNSNVTAGLPTENAGLTVRRGASADAQFIWNETTDTWFAGTSGNLVEIALETDITNLQTQITNNDNDITYLSGQIDGQDEFTELIDTPTTYSNASGYFLTVTQNGTGVEFTDFRTEISTVTSDLQTDINNINGDITNIAGTSGNWDSTYTTVGTNSSNWGMAGVLEEYFASNENVTVYDVDDTFQQKLRLSFTPSASGDYLISWSTQFGGENGQSFVLKLELDDSTIINQMSTVPDKAFDDGARPQFENFSGDDIIEGITAAAHTVDMDYKAVMSGDVVAIAASRIHVRKVDI